MNLATQSTALPNLTADLLSDPLMPVDNLLSQLRVKGSVYLIGSVKYSDTPILLGAIKSDANQLNSTRMHIIFEKNTAKSPIFSWIDKTSELLISGLKKQ